MAGVKAAGLPEGDKIVGGTYVVGASMDPSFVPPSGSMRPTGAAEARQSDLLLLFIRRLHKRSSIPNDVGWDCAECGKPHPCETFRAASGDPGWPRPAGDVLAELDDGAAVLGVGL